MFPYILEEWGGVYSEKLQKITLKSAGCQMLSVRMNKVLQSRKNLNWIKKLWFFFNLHALLVLGIRVKDRLKSFQWEQVFLLFPLKVSK